MARGNGCLPDRSLPHIAHSTRISQLNLGLPGQLVECELPALITSRTELVIGIFGSNPSPVPHRLMTTPAAVHPLPKGEGRQRRLISALSLGERVARVASQVRGFFAQSLATSEFDFNRQPPAYLPTCRSAHLPTAHCPPAYCPLSVSCPRRSAFCIFLCSGASTCSMCRRADFRISAAFARASPWGKEAFVRKSLSC